ncbi:dipeptide ABC transporter ATP-binding protein [Parafrankia sp. FMc2]|uniref:dipeptide ABC transporter ATP-binding protein n=1 Tax=Parafrankia sp. FMc2 TaxID=3233196 RepID=UPI0034D72E2F
MARSERTATASPLPTAGRALPTADGAQPSAGRVQPTAGAGPLITVEDLRVTFATRGGPLAAVRGVSFTLSPGECLAIVGESGSGKSVTARALVGLVGAGGSVSAGRLELAGQDLRDLRERDWRRIRGRRVGLVLQDALSSLDPVRTVGAEIAETLGNHRLVPRAARAARAVELLAEARVPEPAVRARQRPYELSGGLRQRALIASALAGQPSVLVADEPTTALDVSVQAQILDLLAARKADGEALLLISHDLAVVSRLADRVAVMYAGALVEEGSVEDLLRSPRHPYTRELLAAIPSAHARGTRLAIRRDAATGPAVTAPDAAGCRYAARCPLVQARCRSAEPEPVAVEAEVGSRPDKAGPRDTAAAVAVAVAHRAWCWRTDEPWPAPQAGPARGRVRRADDVVIEVDTVWKSFRGPDGSRRPAVRGVSFELRAGETVGLLGESGSGKSTTAEIVLGLLEPDDGAVRLHGRPWSRLPEAARRPDRHRIQLVPQDPLGSFDPRYTVERIVGEALSAPGRRAAARRRDRIVELLGLVGLGAEVLPRRATQLSGGQRQRVAIARALAPEPEVLVCDEPVSALDVSIQAQILDVFADVQDTLGVAMLFISHDLGVIYHACDRVLVMRDGELVEQGDVEQVLRAPAHDYTRALLAAVPRLDTATFA